MKSGNKKIIKYETNILSESVIVIFIIISLSKKIINPIDIDKNKTLNKFSFL